MTRVPYFELLALLNHTKVLNRMCEKVEIGSQRRRRQGVNVQLPNWKRKKKGKIKACESIRVPLTQLDDHYSSRHDTNLVSLVLSMTLQQQ